MNQTTSLSSPLKVAVVEDDLHFRHLLTQLIHREARLTLVDSFGRWTDAADKIPSLAIDVLLVDLGLPDGDGADLIAQLKPQCPTMEYLVLTVQDDDDSLFTALQAGASGYITKTEIQLATLSQSIEEVMRGGAPMSLGIARRVIRHFHSPKEDLHSTQLTTRENEVLNCLARGFNARATAEKLYLAYETVRSHQKNIYRKLQVHSVVAAVRTVQDRSPI